MAVTVANFTANQNDGTASTLATTIPATTAGNALYVFVFWKGATTASITGFVDAGPGQLNRPTDGQCQCFVQNNVAGGITTVTVNFSGSSTAIEAYVYEITGQDTIPTNPTDASFGTGTATSGTTITTNSFTPTRAGRILSAAFADPTGQPTGDTGYFVQYNPLDQGIVIQDKAFTSGAQTTTANMANALTKGEIMSVAVHAPAVSGMGLALGNAPHPGTSPGTALQGSGRFIMNWWPYSPPSAFDPALMAAMEKMGNDPIILPPQVVADGMTPSDNVPS